MDAPEDNRDIKLFRASADLLPEIARRLGNLLTGLLETKEPLDHQLWVPDSQVLKLIHLVSNTSGGRKVLD